MPIQEFLHGKSFDPKTLANLNAAFEAVCAEIGIPERAQRSRELVARKILEFSDCLSDPEAIRAAVIAFLKSPQ
jgi:hypothetical protein